MNNRVHIQEQQEKPLIVWQAHEGNLSGANIAMLEYIDALHATYRSHVILPHEGSMRKALAERNVPVTIIPQYGWAEIIPAGSYVKRIKRFIRTRIAVKAIEELLQQAKAAFVCTNTLVPFVAAKAAYKLGLPHVWWIHEYGEEDFGFSIGNGNASNAYANMQQWSKLIICNSDAVTKKFRTLLPAVQVERIYQPVSWRVRALQNAATEAEYLMFGQIVASKGHPEVLEAMALSAKEGHRVQLHIKGPCEDPVYIKRLHQLIAMHGLTEQVKIETGFFVKEEEMPKYKVLLIASRSEAFGRVIVEANKAGLRVVVKNSGGAPELVNETNGLLYTTTGELSAIFSRKTMLPNTGIRFNYNEATELQRLHHLLSSIA
ncbi:glycosyltransferase involved in cell wall biosynthesis [Lacibacter cauensis]|uniref:Glycosyltransferase involved in cell wall biosynthesis n=1 Tax=Lacibacter cauensis TaxID=510947 RepID=A0A562SJX4_9BACT|nr:glycosyltransferase family 4 protein [Lacibacter cauensis]TWI81403.1 glycosyltransferase involved in cell wall biosynthesis [Lacibacter cauensis]